MDVAAIGNESSLAYLIDDVPMPVEDVQEKKDKDDAGGGGGGGKEDPNPVNQGDLPDQTKNPIRPPDPNVHRANFELQTPPPSTEGNMKFEKKYGRWGDPNSLSQIGSSGPGSGGGMGTGVGTGAGSGRGTGTGSGDGSGYGSGVGDGNGPGSGSGTGGAPPPVAKVTTPYRIISKPRPGYTDAARANQVTGTVALKVTLLASGQVGSIVPVRRLPDGLTEQAIAAARQIKFEPKKVNGVAQSISVTIEYSFTIY
jgi:protein TonB